MPDLNWWQCGLFQQGIGAAIGYHRASMLFTYYIGYVGHVPGGVHGFLDAFLRPASYCKWKYIALPWQLLGSLLLPKKAVRNHHSLLLMMYVHCINIIESKCT